jgi:hypothetical protein
MAVVEVMAREEFFQTHRSSSWYVGFLHSKVAWFPLRLVSDPGPEPRLDTLFVSASSRAMDELVKQYASKLPQVSETFVQRLHAKEIENIVDVYSLAKVALVSSTGSHDRCGCGCDCG